MTSLSISLCRDSNSEFLSHFVFSLLSPSEHIWEKPSVGMFTLKKTTEWNRLRIAIKNSVAGLPYFLYWFLFVYYGFSFFFSIF